MIDVAEIEPPDIVAVVTTKDVWLPYVELMLPYVTVLVVRGDTNRPVPLTSSV